MVPPVFGRPYAASSTKSMRCRMSMARERSEAKTTLAFSEETSSGSRPA
jgi:hypothetical protein